VIIATGPLTSDALAEIARLTGSERLFFYDSISPIVDAESVDQHRLLRPRATANRSTAPTTI
jgi:methylenetetrahydrofolate--tRNA-(uracil-5-)-methyltransferase